MGATEPKRGSRRIRGGVSVRVLLRNRMGRTCVCVCVCACTFVSYICVCTHRHIDMIHFKELTYPTVGAGAVFRRRAERLETRQVLKLQFESRISSSSGKPQLSF